MPVETTWAWSVARSGCAPVPHPAVTDPQAGDRAVSLSWGNLGAVGGSLHPKHLCAPSLTGSIPGCSTWAGVGSGVWVRVAPGVSLRAPGPSVAQPALGVMSCHGLHTSDRSLCCSSDSRRSQLSVCPCPSFSSHGRVEGVNGARVCPTPLPRPVLVRARPGRTCQGLTRPGLFKHLG